MPMGCLGMRRVGEDTVCVVIVVIVVFGLPCKERKGKGLEAGRISLANETVNSMCGRRLHGGPEHDFVDFSASCVSWAVDFLQGSHGSKPASSWVLSS